MEQQEPNVTYNVLEIIDEKYLLHPVKVAVIEISGHKDNKEKKYFIRLNDISKTMNKQLGGSRKTKQFKKEVLLQSDKYGYDVEYKYKGDNSEQGYYYSEDGILSIASLIDHQLIDIANAIINKMQYHSSEEVKNQFEQLAVEAYQQLNIDIPNYEQFKEKNPNGLNGLMFNNFLPENQKILIDSLIDKLQDTKETIDVVHDEFSESNSYYEQPIQKDKELCGILIQIQKDKQQLQPLQTYLIMYIQELFTRTWAKCGNFRDQFENEYYNTIRYIINNKQEENTRYLREFLRNEVLIKKQHETTKKKYKVNI